MYNLCCCLQDLVYKHKIFKRLGKALSTAVRLLLLQEEQQQKPKHKPSQADKQDKAAAPAMELLDSLTVLVNAWAASTTAAQRDADLLQVALQVAESGVWRVEAFKFIKQ